MTAAEIRARILTEAEGALTGRRRYDPTYGCPPGRTRTEGREGGVYRRGPLRVVPSLSAGRGGEIVLHVARDEAPFAPTRGDLVRAGMAFIPATLGVAVTSPGAGVARGGSALARRLAAEGDAMSNHDRSAPHEPSSWERVKEALRRDWDQTRHDLGLASGQDLHQGLQDTVAQASGNEPIPSRHVANASEGWSDEAAVRFGYESARSPNYPGEQAWNASVESQLQRDWEATPSGRPWSEVRLAVRYGWTRATSHAARGV